MRVDENLTVKRAQELRNANAKLNLYLAAHYQEQNQCCPQINVGVKFKITTLNRGAGG